MARLRPRRSLVAAVVFVIAFLALPSAAYLFVNTWWLEMEGAVHICYEREPNAQLVRTPREGLLGFRCMYGNGRQEIEGSKVWIWNRS